MSKEEITLAENSATEKSKGAVLESGTYEIIKKRLDQHGKELKEKLDNLNNSRKEVFGTIEPVLIGSERIITKNNCIPRDMIPVGNKFIFGYNVHMGLKSTVSLSDVFAVYEYKEKQFIEQSLNIIESEKFTNDFTELYKFYKNTYFAKFSTIGPYLYMVFQTGKLSSDFKAFKWLIEENSLSYVDNRSDHEVKFPDQHEFRWKRTKREDHRYGSYPHISIEERVFVETVDGDLTIKVEDNTDTGKGLYAEDVENFAK